MNAKHNHEEQAFPSEALRRRVAASTPAVPPRSCDAAFMPWGSRGMNLQLFAEGGDGSAGGQDGGAGTSGSAGGQGGGAGTSGGDDAKTLTQAEVDALIEKRLARERRDAEKRTADAVEKARKEAEERARMTEEERGKADRERAEKAAKEREEQLSKREAEITRRELRAQAAEALIKKDLPKELGKLLDYSSEDAMQDSLTNVEKVFRAAVQAGVDARIAQGGRRVESSGGSKPDADKMSDEEYYASLKK